MKKDLFIAFLVITTSLYVSGCSYIFGPRLNEYRQTREVFGTFVSIDAFYTDDVDIRQVIEACWKRMSEIQRTMTVKADYGEVAFINSSGSWPVVVSQDVYMLIEEALLFSELTDGAFDITVLPLVQLWKAAAARGTLPSISEIDDAREKVGYRAVELLDGSRLVLRKQGMKIDLGAIAKGYAVDEAVRILLKSGVKDFLINAGGDIYCKGLYRGRRPWRIGVQDPLRPGAIIDILNISDCAVTTSGDYERFYIIDGEKYSHIIDPSTGWPEDVVISATVIAPTAEEADALATACAVSGSGKGLRLINSLEGVEAMMIEKSGDGVSTHRSNGFERYR